MRTFLLCVLASVLAAQSAISGGLGEIIGQSDKNLSELYTTNTFKSAVKLSRGYSDVIAQFTVFHAASDSTPLRMKSRNPDNFLGPHSLRCLLAQLQELAKAEKRLSAEQHRHKIILKLWQHSFMGDYDNANFANRPDKNQVIARIRASGNIDGYKSSFLRKLQLRTHGYRADDKIGLVLETAVMADGSCRLFSADEIVTAINEPLTKLKTRDAIRDGLKNANAGGPAYAAVTRPGECKTGEVICNHDFEQKNNKRGEKNIILTDAANSEPAT